MVLRDMMAAKATDDELTAAKQEMMEEIHRILLVFFGEPPSKFDWTFYDKDGKFQRFEGLTPQSFYKDLVPFDVNEMISVINDPRNEYGKLYTVAHLGNIAGGVPIRYLNLPIDDLRRLAMKKIDEGIPVWFGCDVGKHFHRELGVMDDKIYDYELVFGTSPSMDKRQRLLYGESLMTHAMVFTGYNKLREGDDKPNQWRVENSWGEKNGDKGYLVMSDTWFDQFMYQIAIDKASLAPELVAKFDEEPIVLPAWDPMGSLALAM